MSTAFVDHDARLARGQLMYDEKCPAAYYSFDTTHDFNELSILDPFLYPRLIMLSLEVHHLLLR